MTNAVSLAKNGRTLTVRVPLALRKRGGRKLVIVPEGATWAPPRPRVESTLVKAMARAFRWRKLLETGVYCTIAEIAAAEKINPTYVGRILRFTLLAPDIVEAILNGRQPANLQLAHLLRPFPVEWEWQRREFQRSPLMGAGVKALPYSHRDKTLS
jgi:hypothetical protein